MGESDVDSGQVQETVANFLRREVSWYYVDLHDLHRAQHGPFTLRASRRGRSHEQKLPFSWSIVRMTDEVFHHVIEGDAGTLEEAKKDAEHAIPFVLNELLLKLLK